MARPIPFNRQGVYGLATTGVSATSTEVTYTFENHPYVNNPFNGLLLVRIASPIPDGTTGTLPIYFETTGALGSRKAVTKVGGVPLTAADITGVGYYLFFYDFRTGVVEAVASVV